MPRARFHNQYDWQTAAASENGSGCFSFYILPPLAALVIIGFVAFIAFKLPFSSAALPVSNSTMLFQNAAPAANQDQISPTQFPNTGAVTPIWSFASDKVPSASGLSPVFTKEVQHWGNDIIHWANAASIDPNLAATIMQIESC